MPNDYNDVFNPMDEQPGPNMVEQSSQNAPTPQNTTAPDVPAQGGGTGDSAPQPTSAPGKFSQSPRQTVQEAPAQAKPQSAIEQHQSLFRSVLEGLGGGPTKVQITDPVTGEVREEVRHQTKSGIGASILAGAISGMLGGLQAPNQVDAYGHQDLSGAAKAGADAGKGVADKRQNDAQALEDKKMASAYGVMDHNLKLHAAIMGNTQLQGAVMKQGLETDAPFIDAMQKSNPGAIKFHNLTDDKLRELMADKGPNSAHVTRESVMRDGIIEVRDANGEPVLNSDGSPKTAYTYTVYDPASMVALSDEIKKANPEDFAGIPVGSQIPLRVLAKYGLERTQMDNATALISQWNEKAKEFNPKHKDVDLKAETSGKNSYFKQIIPLLPKYAGKDPDEVLNDMEKDHVDPQLMGKFASMFDVDRTAMAAKRAEDLRADKAKEQRQLSDENLKAEEAKEQRMAIFKKNLGITDSGMLSTKPFTQDWTDKDGNHYDLTSTPVQVVEGFQFPSQMGKRGKGEFEMNKRAANVYSYARYGHPFDFGKADLDAKEAGNQNVRQTLRFLNSLTGDDDKSGNLDEVVQAAKRFGPTTFKSLNDVLAWKNQHLNDTEAVRMATAITETADQVAKILQGGGSGGGTSDAKLQEAKDLFGKGGFSVKQIAGVADELRGLLANRKKSMIANNRFLERQFSEIVGEGAEYAKLKAREKGQQQAQQSQQQTQQQFSKFSSDGLWGWDGKAWVSTGKK